VLVVVSKQILLTDFNWIVQVLLETYPQAKKYLNYKTLEQKLIPRAVIYKNAETSGDPLRDFFIIRANACIECGFSKDKLAILS
jgi:hypothetical protein